jgi:hypothetical protein
MIELKNHASPKISPNKHAFFQMVLAFWKLPFASARYKWLWMNLRGLIQVAPYLILQGAFENSNTSTAVICIVISSAIFAKNVRNLHKLGRFSKRLGLQNKRNQMKSKIEHAYFVSTIAEYSLPVLLISLLLLQKDFSLAVQWVFALLVIIVNLYLSLRMLVPLVDWIRNKSQEFIYFERYLSAFITAVMMLLWISIPSFSNQWGNIALSPIPLIGIPFTARLTEEDFSIHGYTLVLSIILLLFLLTYERIRSMKLVDIYFEFDESIGESL